MSTAENFYNSLLIEGKGVHTLIWDDKADLVRSLIVFFAVYDDKPVFPILLTSVNSTIEKLRPLLEKAGEENCQETVHQDDSVRSNLLLIFLDQAVSNNIGPLLNGWRSVLAESPGTLLIIRSADFLNFQRNAPDLSSFIGPRILDTSTMLSLWCSKTAKMMEPRMPSALGKIIQDLPGETPSECEMIEWIRMHPPVDDSEANEIERI